MVRAAQHLDIPNGVLAVILNVPDSVVLQLQANAEILPPDSKPYVRGQLLIQLFHHLNAINNGVDEASRHWLNSHCLELDARPINVIRTGQGLMKAVSYLGTRQKR